LDPILLTSAIWEGDNGNLVSFFLNLVAFYRPSFGLYKELQVLSIFNIKEKFTIGSCLLKCLGATKSKTFFNLIYTNRGARLLGRINRTAVGLILQQLFPMFLGDFATVKMYK